MVRIIREKSKRSELKEIAANLIYLSQSLSIIINNVTKKITLHNLSGMSKLI
jgi:hypothetical protein